MRMTLEFEKFCSCAQGFLALSKNFDDSWIMKTIDSKERDFYLEKRCTLPSNSNNKDLHENACTARNFYTFVYHITYSQSYSVPVLYFNAYHSNGKLLTLEEIWSNIPGSYQSSIKNKWDAITQQEHPKLGIPYFTVHPCYTADLMSHCKTSNYLISWLSTVGPLVGLNLSTDYAKYAFCNKVKE